MFLLLLITLFTSTVNNVFTLESKLIVETPYGIDSIKCYKNPYGTESTCGGWDKTTKQYVCYTYYEYLEWNLNYEVRCRLKINNEEFSFFGSTIYHPWNRRDFYQNITAGMENGYPIINYKIIDYDNPDGLAEWKQNKDVIKNI